VTLGLSQTRDNRNPSAALLKPKKKWVFIRTLAGIEPGFFNTGTTQQQLIQLFWHHPVFCPEVLKTG
jgi:hypothetical protein